MTPRMQRTLVHRLLAELPRDASRSDSGAGSRRAVSLPDRAQAIAGDAFPAAGHDIESLERVPIAGAAAADLRRVLSLSGRARPAQAAAARRTARRGAVVVDDRIRESARRVLPFKLTDGQKTALARNRHRHAAARADEPAAARRRRRGQDDRRAAGGARRDGERLSGRVHGADRDPRGPALPDDPRGCSTVAVPRSRRSPAASTPREAARDSRGARERRDSSGRRHARAGRAGRGVSRARPRRSSTSSIGSA